MWKEYCGGVLNKTTTSTDIPNEETMASSQGKRILAWKSREILSVLKCVY